jgi:hypothetical protein
VVDDQQEIKDIAQIVEVLCHRFGAHPLSHVRTAPADIDIFLPPEQADAARAFVCQEGFIITRAIKGQTVARRFEDGGKLFILDLLSDFNVYTDYLPSLKLSAKGSLTLGHNPDLHACFKALCFNARHKLPAVETQWVALTLFLTTPSNFLKMPRALKRIAPRGAAALFSYLSQISFLSRFLGRLRFRAQAVGTGCSLAFIGPDGSGKTFFIDKMRGIGPTSVVYMGDWFFTFQKLYTYILENVPSPWNRFLYPVYFVENLIRQAKVSGLRFVGKIVLIDRFPGTNRNLRNDGALFTLNRLTFRCFPKPDWLIFLYAPPEVIYQRKQELSVPEITELHKKIQLVLGGERHCVLNTLELDESLNHLARLAFAHIPCNNRTGKK